MMLRPLIDVDTKWSIIYDNISCYGDSSRFDLDRSFRGNNLDINERTFRFISINNYCENKMNKRCKIML